MSYTRRRYRVKEKRGDKHVFEKEWDEPDDWFVTKDEARAEWDKKHPVAVAEKPAEAPKRRGRPPKAEVITGVVE